MSGGEIICNFANDFGRANPESCSNSLLHHSNNILTLVPALLIIFVLGYLMIASEHVLHINKAVFALIMCGLLWAVYAVNGHDPNLSTDMVEALGDTCEIVVFLIGAMTIVELIDRYGGFHIIVENLHASNKRKLMWVLAFVAFFLSSVLDNMTTTIIMVMMLRRLLSDQKDRWIFACVIVLAANAGGAWSPIGDITTIMLWMKNYVSSVDLIVNLLLPSIISVIVPVSIASHMVPATPVEPLNDHDTRVGYQLSEHHKGLSIFILMRSGRSAFRAGLQGHYTSGTLYGHTAVAGRAMADYRNSGALLQTRRQNGRTCKPGGEKHRYEHHTLLSGHSYGCGRTQSGRHT